MAIIASIGWGLYRREKKLSKKQIIPPLENKLNNPKTIDSGENKRARTIE